MSRKRKSEPTSAKPGKLRKIPPNFRRYLRDPDNVRDYLNKFKTFTPSKWKVNTLVEWVSTTLTTSQAEYVLSNLGYERAKEIYSVQRIPIKDWALSRPGWWEVFKESQSKHLSDYFIYEEPKLDMSKIPAETKYWWSQYIEEPKDKNYWLRCGYLIAAKLLNENFTEYQLLKFVTEQINVEKSQYQDKDKKIFNLLNNIARGDSNNQDNDVDNQEETVNELPDTTYCEWNLTKDGWKRFEFLTNKQKDSQHSKHINNEIKGQRAPRRTKPSDHIITLRSKLFDARQEYVKHYDEQRGNNSGKMLTWKEWIPEFKKKLKPKTLLDVDITNLDYIDPKKAKTLTTEEWHKLYKQEEKARGKRGKRNYLRG